MIATIDGNSQASAEKALRECITALEHVTTYRLPAGIDRRLLWLSENKEQLSEAEHEELMSLIEFTEDRTVEKLQARTALRCMAEVWPQFITSQP